MSRNLLSNLVILSLFATGFFGLTFAINWLSRTENQPQHEFSFERRMADDYLSQNNWQAAARYYKKLCVDDPENGGAKVSYAWSVSQQQQPYLNQIRRELRSLRPDAAVIEQATADANRFAGEAIDAWEDVLEFANFRNNALFRLSLLHALVGNREQALEYLRRSRKAGYRPRFALTNYAHYWPLFEDPDFRAFLR